MYFNVSKNRVLSTNDIIGIFDLDTSTVQKKTRDMLSRAEKEKKVEVLDYDLPKSFILSKDKIYISKLSVQTILALTDESSVSLPQKETKK